MIDDVRAAVKFYTTHLGFSLDLDASPAFASVTRDGVRLLLSGKTSSGRRPMPDGREPVPGGWNRIHIQVDDLEAEVKRLRKAGLKFRNEIVKGPAEEAEPLLREALDIRNRILAPDDWYIARDGSYLGECLTALGKYAEAERLLVDGFKLMKISPQAPSPRVRQADARVIKLYEAWGKAEEAATWRKELEPLAATPVGATSP
jgi:catechol 2,3-dioxygenase-like lactoylglutathione lyase family enzyme